MGRAQRGVALLLVLWMTALITVLAGSFAVLARTEGLQSRYLFETSKARYAAEAGLHRAAWELRNPDQETRWIADGRTYTFEFDGARIEVEMTDESGKIDINAADELTLANLFLSVDLDQQLVDELVDAVIDWRDTDDLVRPFGAEDEDYESLEYAYGAKDAPFDTVPELQQVMGMNYEIFRLVEPSVTVYSGRGQFNPAFAPESVLMTIPEMTPELLEDFLVQRELASRPGGPPAALPDGTVAVAQGGSGTYSIRARAQMPNGSRARIEATVRLGGNFLRRPFRVLRWKTAFME